MTVTANFTPEIHGWVNTTNDVNFTQGFEIEVSSANNHAICYIHCRTDLNRRNPALEYSYIFKIPQKCYSSICESHHQCTNIRGGSNPTRNSSVSTLPFTSTKGDIEMSFELSFRPQFIFNVSFPDQTASVDFATYFDGPKLDVQVTQVHNINATCDPAPSSLAADQIFRNLTNLKSSVGVDSFILTGEEVIGITLDQPPILGGTLYNLPTACLAFNPAAKTLGPAAQAEPSQINASFVTKMETYNLAAGMLLAVVPVVFATF